MIRKLHNFKRRFSIAAPQLAVRPHLPWYVRWSLVIPFVVGAGWLIWWAYGSGLELAGFHREQAEDELSRLHRQVGELQNTNTKLNSQVVDFGRQIQMQLATIAEMERQLKSLNDEKAHLNEDLAFFQNLTQSGNREENLTIQRLKVERGSLPGEYHCGMLLVQGGQRPKDFHGNLQLVANVVHDNQNSVMVFPEKNSPEFAAYQLDFKYYQRVERTIQLPPGTTLESIQVRVYERGATEPKARQDAALS